MSDRKHSVLGRIGYIKKMWYLEINNEGKGEKRREVRILQKTKRNKIIGWLPSSPAHKLKTFLEWKRKGSGSSQPVITEYNIRDSMRTDHT